MATKLSATMPTYMQNQILNTLVTAAFTLHSGKAVLDYARALFEPVSVEQAVTERKVDEKEVGANGSWGEGEACKSLARAHALLVDQGEEDNAKELKKVALSRFTRDTWEENVEAVRTGW